MSIENLNEKEIASRESMISAMKSEVKPTYQHYGSVENMSDREIASRESMIGAMKSEVKPTYQHYGSVENLSDREIASRESMISAMKSEVKPTYQHYGSVENMSDREIASRESMISAMKSEVKPTYQHYGSVENMSENETSVMEAQVAEKRQQDIPTKQYLNLLVDNPKTFDEALFESSIIRSMQSNGIIVEFINNLIEKISEKTYQFKNVDKNDKESIQKLKLEIENLVIIYEKYLYKLKENGWGFYNLSSMKLPDEYLEDLWQIQKSFDITFNMKIPSGIDEYYGEKFERDGKMLPGIRLMYDELMGKEVNWYQTITYKEGELTPKQRFYQRQIEKFEKARQEELNRTLNQTKQMQSENMSGKKL